MRCWWRRTSRSTEEGEAEGAGFFVDELPLFGEGAVAAAGATSFFAALVGETGGDLARGSGAAAGAGASLARKRRGMAGF